MDAPAIRARTDGLAVDPSPPEARPDYFTWFVEPTFGGAALRIAAVTGAALSTTAPGSDWASIARHHYSRDQPWSADGKLLALENKRGTPSTLYLDGNTYRLLDVTSTPGIRYADWRWHPTLADVQIVDDDEARTLYWTNVRTHARLWSFDFSAELPAFSHSDGIGSFEGNPSNDGRFVALSDAATRGLDSTGVPLSPLAGWVYPLKHADMMMDRSTPILVGVNGCGAVGDESDRVGRILRVDLLTGAVSRLSTKDRVAGKGAARNMPALYRHEASAMHVSCRNSARSGWAYVTYDAGAGKRFSDEIVAVRIDSSGAVERFAHTHSEPDSIPPGPNAVRLHFYDAEPQAVPSRDGGRVLWASNWDRDCAGDCGPMSEVKDYIVDARCGSQVVTATENATSAGVTPPTDAVASLTSIPNPFTKETSIQFELRTASMVRLELFDAQGRRVAQVANRYFLAGRHALPWNRLGAAGETVRPGIYVCRLTAGTVRDQRQLVLLP